MNNLKALNQDMEVVLVEMERNLMVLETNYRKAVANLALIRQRVETDDLTKLLRRGAFMRKVHSLLESSKKEGREVQLMMIDVDHFKKVNDTYGHQSGDEVLERISELLRNYLRPKDLAGRYGGEELIVAIQGTLAEAVGIAENIRKAVEKHRMVSKAFQAGAEFTVTLSMGVASTQTFGYEANRLIEKADAALYRAKKSGRNRVLVALNVCDASDPKAA